MPSASRESYQIMRKRKKKKRYVLRAMLFMLVAVIVGAGLYLYPAWRAAKALQDKIGLCYGSFALEVQLDREKLPEEQEKLFAMLARLTGIQEEAMYRLSMRGNVQEDKIHLMIYPYDATEPLAEFYLSEDINVINETMLYNAIRGKLTERVGLLDYLMPRQEETLYMTLEQVEQLFGLDLSAFKGFDLSVLDRKFTAKEYFLMLAVMSREKREDGYRFTLETEQAELSFDMSGRGEDETVGMELEIRDVSEVLAKGYRVSSLLGSWMPGKELEMVKSFSMTLTWSEDGAITIPTNLADQETIEAISGIRAWIQDIFG